MKRLLTVILSTVLLITGVGVNPAYAYETSFPNPPRTISAPDVNVLRGWRGVAYGNGLFVAVARTGTGNRVMTSPDGITWTARATPIDHFWSSVTFGNGLFVAVAALGSVSGNRAMTSADGITWTLRVTPVDHVWSNVTYGNNLFVAVADYGGVSGNRVMTSPDGITWSSRVTPANHYWKGVTYGNGRFVAVGIPGDEGSPVMTSPDGISWTQGVTPADYSWRSVTFGNGLFVAVAASGSGNRVMTSPDGLNWSLRLTPEDHGWESVTFGNGIFVAVAEYVAVEGKRMMTSSDGIAWTSRVTTVQGSWTSVIYGNGVFIAVSDNDSANPVMRIIFAPLPNEDNRVSRAAAIAAEAARREAEKRSARLDISDKFKRAEKVTIENFRQAEIYVAPGDFEKVQMEVLALPEALRADIKQVLQVALKYEVVGKVSTDKVRTVFSKDLITVGLIPVGSLHKATLTAILRKLPASRRSDYSTIKATLDSEIIKIQNRKDRLAKLLGRTRG